MKASILDAIKRSAAVPSMPQVVMRFLEILQDPNFDYQNLARVLSVDPGTVSEVLRLSNSAMFGVRNEITSLRQALTLLGPKRVRSLVLGRYLVQSMQQLSAGGLDMGYFWRRSLVCGILCSHLAGEVLPQLREEAFLAGLLADIGIPILVQAVPERFQRVADQYRPEGHDLSEDDERATAETTHAEVSAIVLHYWSLPALITQAVDLHQSTQRGKADESGRLARIIYAADRISKLLCEVPKGEAAHHVCEDASHFVGISLESLAEMLKGLEGDVTELAGLLRIDVLPSAVYARINESIQQKLLAASSH